MSNDPFFTKQKLFTNEDYSGFTDFYGGALDASINVNTINEDEPVTDDPKSDEKDTTSVLNPVQSDSRSPNDQPRAVTQTFGSTDYTPTYKTEIYGIENINTQFGGGDKSDNFIKKGFNNTFGVNITSDYATESALAPLNLLTGNPLASTVAGGLFGQQKDAPFSTSDGSMQNVPIGGLARISLDIANSFHVKNGAAIQNSVLQGGGNAGALMSINGLRISRPPGKFNYTGNTSGLNTQQLRSLEGANYGFIGGFKEEFDKATGEWNRTGTKGLMTLVSGGDSDHAIQNGGDYNASTGTYTDALGNTAGGGTKRDAQRAIAVVNKQFGSNLSWQEIAATRKQVKTSLFGEVVSGPTFQEILESKARANAATAGTATEAPSAVAPKTTYKRFTPSSILAGNRRYTTSDGRKVNLQELNDHNRQVAEGKKIAAVAAQRRQEQDNREKQLEAQREAQEAAFTPDRRQQEQQQTGADAGDYDSASNTYSSTGNEYDFRFGGRVGYALGGAVTDPIQNTGYVGGSPKNYSMGMTVADTENLQVREGSFVINAPTVERLQKEGRLPKGTQKRKAAKGGKMMDVALSKGEYLVDVNDIDKFGGYDKLTTENNKGKAEVTRRQNLSNGGVAADSANYEDKIVIDEVRRKMDALMDEVAARDNPVEVISNYFKSGSAQKEYDDAQAEKNQRVPIGGTFYKATAGEYNRVSVPKTPTLFNLFAMAEEVAHLDSLKPGNPKTRKNPYSKPEYDLLKDFNNVTGGLFSGTRVMGQDYDAHQTFNEESKYLEEMRAKQIAFQTVFGGLAERQVENTKAGKTIKYTKASYQKMFADYISAFASPVVKAAFFEKYPDLKSVYRETPVDDQLKEQADTERTRERILLREELQKKVKDKKSYAEGDVVTDDQNFYTDVEEEEYPGGIEDFLKLGNAYPSRFTGSSDAVAVEKARVAAMKLFNKLQPEDALALTMMGEAESLGYEGMEAVGHVVMNRVNSGYREYAQQEDVHAVVTRRIKGKSPQFNALDYKNLRKAVREFNKNPDKLTKYNRVRDIAEEIIAGTRDDFTKGSLIFWNPNLSTNNHIRDGIADGTYEVVTTQGSGNVVHEMIRPSASELEKYSTKSPSDIQMAAREKGMIITPAPLENTGDMVESFMKTPSPSKDTNKQIQSAPIDDSDEGFIQKSAEEYMGNRYP